MDRQAQELEDRLHQPELEVGNPAGRLQGQQQEDRPGLQEGNLDLRVDMPPHPQEDSKHRQLEGDTPQGLLGNQPLPAWVGLGRVVGDLWGLQQESEMQLGKKEGLSL